MRFIKDTLSYDPYLTKLIHLYFGCLGLAILVDDQMNYSKEKYLTSINCREHKCQVFVERIQFSTLRSTLISLGYINIVHIRKM